MLFSKSFGYALRGILYIASMQDEQRLVQIDEIASQLGVPRHFMGKVLKRLVKERILVSTKGPYGGFSLHNQTLSLSLLSIYEITDSLTAFKNCVLCLKQCDAQNPCPMHYKIECIKESLMSLLSTSTINDLIKGEKGEFIKSLVNGCSNKEPFDHLLLQQNS